MNNKRIYGMWVMDVVYAMENFPFKWQNQILYKSIMNICILHPSMMVERFNFHWWHSIYMYDVPETILYLLNMCLTMRENRKPQTFLGKKYYDFPSKVNAKYTRTKFPLSILMTCQYSIPNSRNCVIAIVAQKRCQTFQKWKNSWQKSNA